MVGHEHVDPARGRGRDPLDARDSVVDGHEQVRRALRGERDDFRRQAVAELEAVGHDEADVGTQRRQPAHRDRAGRRAVGVVVRDDDDALARGDRAREALRGFGDAAQRSERRQRRQRVVELACRADAA